MRKGIIACGLLAWFCSFSHAAGGRKTFQLYDFSKGVDTYHNPTTLPDGFVQNSNNVFFDEQGSGQKRQGYTVAWSTKQYQYTGFWTYVDQNNNTWQIVRSSDEIVANNLTGGPAVLVATVSVNNLIGEANAFGNAYFVDQTQGVYYWNGSSTSYVASSPMGSIITQFHGRLVVAGAAVPNGNQLYLSGYFAGNTWTTGLNPTDPAQYSVGLQDNFDNITAEYVYLDTLYIFKHYSIFALYGFDQTSFQISQLTQECGCIDGNTIQTYNSGLKFVSLRGVENFNGYSCTRISDPVKNKVDASIQVSGFSQQSWVQSQTADWLSGTIVHLDTTSFSPSIALTNPTLGIVNPSFENGFTNWTAQSEWSNVSSNIGASCTTTPKDGSFMAMSASADPGNCGVPCNTLTVSIKYSTNTATLISSGTFANVSACDIENWVPYSLPTNVPTGTSVVMTFTNNDGNSLSQTFLVSGSSVSFWENLDFGTAANPNITFIYLDLFTGQPLSITNSTGSFKSQVHNVGSINSWGNFSAQSVLNGGAIVYSICSSSSSNMSSGSCSAQAANAQITIATNTYVQWYATFTVTAATQAPTLQSGTVQWFSGNLPTPMSSTVWNDDYYLSLTTNTFDSANDAVLVLDSKGAWAPMDLHVGAFTQTRNHLYHADSRATGNIYVDNQGESDNGNPINAFLTTKNEALGDLASDDYFYTLYPSASNTGPCTMTVNYTVDSSTSTYSMGSPLLSEFGTMSSVRLPFPVDPAHQDFGQSVSFTFGTDDGQCDWQFLGAEGIFRARPQQ